MKVLTNLKVPTGNILIVKGQKGKLEMLSVGDYGKEANLKCDKMGLTRDIPKVSHRKIGKDKGNRETTDEETLSVIKKFLKNNRETYSQIKEKFDHHMHPQLKAEKEILESYLPKQFTEKELENVVSEIISIHGYNSKKDMGQVMKVLKGKYGGQYDGKIASNIVRNML